MSLRPYEVMIILDPDLEERTVAPSLDTYLNVVRQDGGSVDNVDVWGKRRLAYEINKKNEGIYAVVNFTANSDATVELDRQLKLSEAVMRTKVLRAEEGFAQVAAAKVLADAKAARKAAAPAKAPAAADTVAEKPVAEKPAAAKAEKPAAKAETAEAPAAADEAPAKPAAKADKDAE